MKIAVIASSRLVQRTRPSLLKSGNPRCGRNSGMASRNCQEYDSGEDETP
jgi:hypothetical protein